MSSMVVVVIEIPLDNILAVMTIQR